MGFSLTNPEVFNEGPQDFYFSESGRTEVHSEN
jgi:hypothetical protein